MPPCTELHVTERDGQGFSEGEFGPDRIRGSTGPVSHLRGGVPYAPVAARSASCGRVALRTEPASAGLFRDSRPCSDRGAGGVRTSWWLMIPFVALKAPPEGELMFSAPARRFTQMIFVPAEREFELVLMTEAESAERTARPPDLRQPRNLGHGFGLTRTIFDGTYRNVFRAARAKAPKRRGRLIANRPRAIRPEVSVRRRRPDQTPLRDGGGDGGGGDDGGDNGSGKDRGSIGRISPGLAHARCRRPAAD